VFPSPVRPVPFVAGAVIGLALSQSVAAASSQTVFLPSGRPAFAEKLSQGLIGFSIEMDRWPSWAGDAVGKPNAYVNQVLSVMGSFTGVPPPLRVGGGWCGEFVAYRQRCRQIDLLTCSQQRGQGLHPARCPCNQRFVPRSNRIYSLSRSRHHRDRQGLLRIVVELAEGNEVVSAASSGTTQTLC
jgi:hypothetical protein